MIWSDPLDAVELADEIAALYPVEADRPPAAARAHDAALAAVCDVAGPWVVVARGAAGADLWTYRRGRPVPARPSSHYGPGHEEDVVVAVECLRGGLGATVIEVRSDRGCTTSKQLGGEH